MSLLDKLAAVAAAKKALLPEGIDVFGMPIEEVSGNLREVCCFFTTVYSIALSRNECNKTYVVLKSFCTVTVPKCQNTDSIIYVRFFPLHRNITRRYKSPCFSRSRSHALLTIKPKHFGLLR